MVGRILSCPKCGRTLTVPTPFKAQDKLDEMVEKGYTPARRKIGIPVDPRAKRKHLIFLAGIVVTALLLLSVLYLIFS
jgi:hypothetical protein